MATPFARLASMVGDGSAVHTPEIVMGEIISLAPLRVRVGEIDLETEDLRLCEHIRLPQVPGGKLVLVSFDEGQSFIALGRC